MVRGVFSWFGALMTGTAMALGRVYCIQQVEPEAPRSVKKTLRV